MHESECRPRVPASSPKCVTCDCEGSLYLDEGRMCTRCMQVCVTRILAEKSYAK